MTTRLSAFITARRAVTGSVAALAIKASGAVLMMLVFLLAARNLSPADFGRLAITFNLASFLAVVAVLGQDTLIMRSWSEYTGAGRLGLARGAFWFGWCVSLAGAGGAAVLVFIAGPMVDARLGSAELVAVAAFVCGQVALHYSSHASRTIGGYVVSETNRELTSRLVLLGAVGAAAQALTLPSFFWAAAAGMVLAVAAQSAALLRGFPRAVRAAAIETSPALWFARARAMSMSASIEAASQYVEVVLLGLLTTPAIAGAYFVAARLANLFPMLATGLHTYSISHMTRLFYAGETGALQHILRSVMGVALLLTAPLLLGVILLGGPLLSIFGPAYAAQYPILLVLAVASFCVSMCGPAPGLLLTTGEERLYSRIVFGALVARVALLALLAPRYGGLGAAASWAVVNTPVAIALVVLCRARCGIDPSVRCLLDPAPDQIAV